jgi:hypothetical protein
MGPPCVSDEDWAELKELLLSISKEHDEITAFTAENNGLHVIVELMVRCYESGRTRTLPSYWTSAYETMVGRRDPGFKTYQKHREMVKGLDKIYKHLDTLDMTELTGGPMRDFLQKKNKKRKKN